MQAWHALVGDGATRILWWQMSLRAVIVLVYGLAAIRLLGRRAFGRQSPLDIVIAIVIGSSLSRALTGNAKLIDTLVATTVFLLLYWALDHLAARWPVLGRVVKGRPIPLIENGRIRGAEMRASAVTPHDIEEAARCAGHEGLGALETAMLERNGQISTIAKK